MNILTGQTLSPAYARPGTSAWTVRVAPHLVAESGHPGREPLDEAIVELPEILLELSHLDHHTPILAGAVKGGVAGLAAVRAAQLFQLPGVAPKIEGASSLALATASIASMLPGGIAHAVGTSARVAHGAMEMGLGARQFVDGLKENANWQQVADGALGVTKGVAVIAPAFVPSLATAGHVVELGALVGRVAIKHFGGDSGHHG